MEVTGNLPVGMGAVPRSSLGVNGVCVEGDGEERMAYVMAGVSCPEGGAF